MDWKILVTVLVGLVIFGFVRFCSDENKPDWDKVRSEEMSKAAAARESEKVKERRSKKAHALEVSREKRGKRPEEKTGVIKSKDYEAVFTTRGGSLKSFTLKHPQYVEHPRNWDTGAREKDSETLVPVNMVSTNPDFELNNPLRFEIFQGLDGFITDADYELIEKTATRVVFRYKQSNLPVVITKKFEINKASETFQIWATVQVTNTGDKKVSFLPGMVQTGYQSTDEVSGGMFSKQPNLLQGLCRHGDDELYRVPWNDSDALPGYTGLNVMFAAVETNYFISAMIPSDDLPATCQIRASWPRGSGDDPSWGLIRAEIRWGEISLQPGQSKVFKVKNYLGPKRYKLLQATGHDLEKSVDFGWFAPISRILLWLLFMFQKLIINWGLAIILLTVTVKVVLLPVAHKSFKSTDRMKALKPEVDKINEQYKDDPQEKQKKVMALYKQHKVNPLGGCLPMLLQMPIWIALFRTLRSSPELYRAPFIGWITDLSEPDPYFVTPILMGIAMFIQQQLTPMTGDNAQAQMMKYLMPIMFTGMMLFLPSGLTLYIFVNVILSIAHQLFIQKMRDRATA